MNSVWTDPFRFECDGQPGCAEGCDGQGVTEIKRHSKSDTNPMRRMLPFCNMPRFDGLGRATIWLAAHAKGPCAAMPDG